MMQRTQTTFSDELRNEIERLMPRAESGSDWAQICALEQIAIAAERGEVCDVDAKPAHA